MSGVPSDRRVPLDSILCTDELRHRRSRPRDQTAENGALTRLVRALADSPGTILQTLSDEILHLLKADSAGVSLLTNDQHGARFYSAAISGAWQSYIGGGAPRHFSPCGDVLDRATPLLFRQFERRYPYFLRQTPPVEECLVVPFYVEHHAVGTIWAITHTAERRFDIEALRQLERLALCATAAYQGFRSSREQEQRHAFLLELGAALRPLADPERIIDEASRRLGEHLRVDRAYYVEVDKGAGVARVRQDYRRAEVASLAGAHALDTYGWILPPLRGGTTVVVSDVARSPLVPDADRPAMEAVGIAALVSVPLVKAGALLGAMSVAESRPRAWAASEVELVREVGERIWAAVERAHAERAARTHEGRLRGQKDAFQAAIHGARLEDALNVLTRMVSEETHGEARTSFFLVDRDRKTLRVVSGAGTMPDSYGDDVDGRHVAEKYGYRGCWSFPIRDRDGQSLGTFVMYFREPRDAAPQDLALADVVTQAAAIIISRHTESEQRAHAEHALRQSEIQSRSFAAELRAVLESMNDAVYIGNAEGITLANQPALDQLGFESFADLNRDVETLAGVIQTRDAATGAILAAADQPFVRALEGARVVREVRIRHRRTGEDRVVRCAASPVVLDGRIAAAVAVNTDITEQKRTEAALRENEERQAFLLEVSDALRPLADAAEITAVSARLLGEHLGADRAAYGEISADGTRLTTIGSFATPGLPAVDGVYAPDEFGEFVLDLRRGRTAVIHDTFAEPAGRNYEKSWGLIGIRAAIAYPVIKHRRLVAVLYVHSLEPRRWTDREIAQVAEVGERTWDAIERARVERALRESEQRFRMLADNISQLAWTCDSLGNVTWFNQRWLDYTGLALDEMKGWNWSKVQHPDHLDRVVATLKRSAETGEPWDDTFPLRGRDGEYRWFLSRAVPIRDETGAIVRWFGTNTDITELRDTQQKLREADRRKDEFLAMLAHELRNPLAPIRTGLELIRLAGDTPEAVGRVRGVLERQVGHMVRLIDDLLDISRITSGKIRLQRTPTAVGELVAAAVEANRAALDAAGLQLAVALPDVPCTLDVDPTRFAQVLSNLLHNATKFTPPGGHVRVAAEILQPSGPDGRPEVVVTVADDGVGISPEMLPRVFDLFSQGKQSAVQSVPGLGIGLALARQLIEMHGGRIDAHSEGPDRGSTFTIRLPCATVRAGDGPRASGAAIDIARRVVIIDDNADAARMLALLIEHLHGDAYVAHDGLSGIARVREVRPDVVLLDIGMPSMDGYETCRRIRSEVEGPAPVIIALTGWGQEQDRQRAADVGFDAHLTKPADVESLAQVLAQLCAKR